MSEACREREPDAMSPTLIREQARDYYNDVKEFRALLEDAEAAADSAWEINFVSDIRVKFDSYGFSMYLSDKQHSTLERLANR